MHALWCANGRCIGLHGCYLQETKFVTKEPSHPNIAVLLTILAVGRSPLIGNVSCRV